MLPLSEVPLPQQAETEPLAPAPLVSCICPTTPARRWSHKSVYRCFSRQTYASRELLVLETGGSGASEFWEAVAAADDRVRYQYEREDAALGEKRNALVSLCRGEVIAHFDDDDVYLPQYLCCMTRALASLGRDPRRLAKLSSFQCYYSSLRKLCERVRRRL